MNATEAETTTKEKTTTEEGSGVKYSFAKGDIVDLSVDEELIDRINNSDKSPITVMRDYVFEKLGGRDIELSDGIIAIMNKTDARHIAESSKSVSEKSQISGIEKIVKLAKFYDEIDVAHKKFSKFRYYELPVRYEGNVSFVTLNVGKGKNDGKYHIYDLTEPKERNTPNRINGFVRPVGNALRKGVSNYSIPNSSVTVNKKFSLPETRPTTDSTGAELSEGQQKFFKKSKLRDSSGRLLKLYHGTKKGGFTKFLSKYSDDGISLFLAKDQELAETYSGSAEKIQLPEGKTGLARLFEKGTDKSKGQVGIYEVYANAQNPYVLECDGANWNSLPFNEDMQDKTRVSENVKSIFNLKALQKNCKAFCFVY